MKRFLAVLLVALMLVSVIPATSMAVSQYATVVGGWLRLRSAPNYNASTITSYYTGTQVKVLGTSGSWYHVEAPDGRTGYMAGNYLKFTGGTVPTGSAVVTSYNGYGVRLRTGPGTGYRVVRTYAVGTVANVLEKGANWSRISINGTVGYMMTQFLNFGGGYDPDTPAVCYATIWSRNGYGVRLRTGPGTGYSKIGVYSVGTRVAVLERGAQWDRVRVGTRVGWMKNEFLTYYTDNQLSYVILNTLSPVVGNVLCVQTIKPEEATVRYEWLRNDGTGAKVVSTNATYAVTTDDIGKTLQLRVTGIGSYTGTVSTAITSKVMPNNQITGVTLNNNAPVAGDTLKATLTPADAQADYVWVVNGKQVGANAAEYTVTDSDVGYKVQVIVTGKGQYSGTANTITTSEVKAVGKVQGVNIVNNRADAAAPVVGDTLTAKVTPDTATVTYKWYADGQEISGASTASYTVTDAVVGKAITVAVTGTGIYTGSSALSAATKPVEAKALTKLVMGELQLHTDTKTVTWAGVDHATVYQYKFGEDGQVFEAQGGESGRKVDYSGHINENLYVRAVGDGVAYDTSDWVKVLCTEPVQQYTLTIVNGNGTTTQQHAEGETVTITADAVPGKQVKDWTFTGAGQVTSQDKATNTLTLVMGAGDATVTVNYEDDPTPATNYSVTVVNGKLTDGTASGSFAQGTTVQATADTITGKKFTNWTVEGVTVADASQSTITFQMPANAVTLTANYEDDPTPVATYTVTVIDGKLADGTTSGSFAQGAAVQATADTITGKHFVSWTVTGVTVADNTLNSISFQMPANAVTLTANFEADAPAKTKLVLQNIHVDANNPSHITWDGVAGADVYEYQFKNGENVLAFGTTGGGDQRYVDFTGYEGKTLLVRAVVNNSETLESSDWVEFTCPASISSSKETTEAKPVVFSDDSELSQEPANETNDSDDAGESNDAVGEPQTYEWEAGSGF